MLKDLIILGAGGFGREASLLTEEINTAGNDLMWRLLGFVDEDKAKWGLHYRGYPVLGGSEVLQKIDRNQVEVICVVGDPTIKRRIVEQAKKQKLTFASLIHPGVRIADDIYMGEGVLINIGCLLTVNIKIGDHVSINPGCGIGHDSVVEEYSTLMWRVNVSGNVKIGESCLLGTGSTVLQGLTIGAGTTVGAGAVVTKNLPDNCTAVGIPARIEKGEFA